MIKRMRKIGRWLWEPVEVASYAYSAILYGPIIGVLIGVLAVCGAL
jgi:hypothetical protein